MSQQTNSLTRRKFLKGAAYTSLLSLGGAYSLAFADNKSKINTENSPTVTLFNQKDETVHLDASQPISLEKVNGWVVVKINKQTSSNPQSAMTLAPGQKMSFAVDAEMAPLLNNINDYVVITNEFTAFDNMVPISTYDTLVA